MQINRLFEMVFLLIDKKSMTAKELAEHFQVSKRTILRDIETLSVSAVPVYTRQGRGGGIFLLDGYVLNKALISKEEQNQILLALQNLSATGHSGTETIFNRLKGLFNITETEWMEVDFSRWGSGVIDKAKFDALKSAILGRQAVSFTYFSSYGEMSKREIFPLKLIFKSKFWYLQGFCVGKQAYRTFKLNRISGVEATGAHFIHEDYTPPPIEDSEVPAASFVTLELIFQPHVAYRVYDEFDEASIDRADNGLLFVNTQMPEDGWLYGFLRSFGKDVEVLKPQRIKEFLQENLK